MSKDIKKALEHCAEWNCDNCPNREELGSGEIVCRGRLLPEVLEYVADLEAKLKESEKDKQFYFFENGEKGLKIRELKKQLGKKEKLIERLQCIIDKLRDKKFAGKTLVEAVNAVYEPLFKNKCDEVEEFKQQLAELKEKLAQYENIEKEIGCDIEVFWKVYRRLSGHGKSDIHLYSIFNNEIVEIMPTEIISGTYSNYPQDCSFKYSIWDKICESYQETYSYFHFHDYNNEWFLSKEEAEAKLKELEDKGE